MVTAHDVAALIIREQGAGERSIDKLQLQKLLYLTQGAHLEFWGEPAFREEMLAYKHGPVIRGVEQTYREAFPDQNEIEGPVGGDPDRLPPEVVDTVQLVLQHFGQWPGTNLERLVKRKGAPWYSARGDLPLDADGNATIELAEIRSWFRQKGVDPGRRPLSERDRSLMDRLRDGDEKALTFLTE